MLSPHAAPTFSQNSCPPYNVWDCPHGSEVQSKGRKSQIGEVMWPPVCITRSIDVIHHYSALAGQRRIEPFLGCLGDGNYCSVAKNTVLVSGVNVISGLHFWSEYGRRSGIGSIIIFDKNEVFWGQSDLASIICRDVVKLRGFVVVFVQKDYDVTVHGFPERIDGQYFVTDAERCHGSHSSIRQPDFGLGWETEEPGLTAVFTPTRSCKGKRRQVKWFVIDVQD